MEELVDFLNVNEIKKKELADYLGISVQFLGQILRGERKMPYDKMKQIKANDKGWNIDMLPECRIVQTIGSHSPNASNTNGSCDVKYITHLEAEVELLRKEKAELLSIIQKLVK